ncbi:MAG: hypothetical protein KGK08_02445 [Acidobacteriota bacterium]|nr:hypothetical protein [Acidobacteriota bacterium]
MTWSNPARAFVLLATLLPAAVTLRAQSDNPTALPDAPSAVRRPGDDPATPQPVIVAAESSFAANGTALAACPISAWHLHLHQHPSDAAHRPACVDTLNPYTRFLNTTVVLPMTPQQKGYLALHNLSDPFNLATIAATSGFSVATSSHSPYGPGMPGFARLAGVSLTQDAIGELFGTFLLPSLTHVDPRYHRLPDAPIPRRILHAVSHTFIATSDLGAPRPNYPTLLTYVLTNEAANLYVPGIQPNAESTTTRVVTGLALDPVDNLITEFLPDVARRIHVRVIFVQRILNTAAAGQPAAD